MTELKMRFQMIIIMWDKIDTLVFSGEIKITTSFQQAPSSTQEKAPPELHTSLPLLCTGQCQFPRPTDKNICFGISLQKDLITVYLRLPLDNKSQVLL